LKWRRFYAVFDKKTEGRGFVTRFMGVTAKIRFWLPRFCIFSNFSALSFQYGIFQKCQMKTQKSSKPFSDLLLLCAAVMGGGYSIFMLGAIYQIGIS
jgi:hypothetical protein